MSVVQDIAIGIKEVTEWDEAEVCLYDSKGEMLEYMLDSVCSLLGDIAHATDGKADIEFILGIVGAYTISRYNGVLEKDTRPPKELFDEILFPAIESMEVKVEEIEYGDGDITPDAEGEV